MIDEVANMSHHRDSVSGVLGAHVYIPVLFGILQAVNEVALPPVLAVWYQHWVDWRQVICLFKVGLHHEFLDDGDAVPVGMGTVRPVDVTGVLVTEKGNLWMLLSILLSQVII
jgi:hypothetical protein